MNVKILVVLGFILLSYTTSSQEVNFNIDQKSWEEDFQFLKKKVEKIVPQYQNKMYKTSFDAVYDIISDSEVGNNKEDVVFALQRLLNTLNDEGCNVPLFQKGVALPVLPIKTYWFNDGLYILDASDNYKDVIGKQVVKINNTTIEEAFKKLKPLLNADNDYYKKYLFQIYGFMPSMLKFLGVENNNDEVLVEFASGESMQIKGSTIQEYSKLSRLLPNDEFFSASNTSYKNENYWFEFLPNTKSLFVQLQQISNNENGDSFSGFVDNVETIIENNKANKLIIDLRYGGGGNGFKLKPLTDMLRDSKVINKKGHLFVLTSKATRGTLLELASILKLNTKAVIVGEPTAEGANTVGDIKYVTLPNSGLIVSLTHTLWPTSWKNDTSTFLLPDEQIVFNYSDKVQGIDPWLNVVGNYKVRESQKSVPNDLKNKLLGTYKISGRKVTIAHKNGRLFLMMNRKMKSFFEIYTELYFKSEGVLSTDIEGVTLNYTTTNLNEVTLQSLHWNQLVLKIQ